LTLIGDPQDLVKAIHGAMKSERALIQEQKSDRLALSAIGGCERNLWATVHGVPESSGRGFSGRMLVLFSLGDAIEFQIVGLLRKAGCIVEDVDPLTNEQFRVVVGDLASGRLDGKIYVKPDDLEPALLEIKSANSKSFGKLWGTGYEKWNPKYAAQIQIYMRLAGLKSAVVIVENKDDSELYVEGILLDEEAADALIAKAMRVTTSEDVLPRPVEAKSPSCSFCKWCPRIKWCWFPTQEEKAVRKGGKP